jgi:uncharacterized caspase-like protein
MMRINKLLVTLAFLISFNASASNAILIGVNTYAYSPLSNPVNDVALISKKLNSLGWNVTVLNNPTVKKLKSTVERFASKIPKGTTSTTLLYFSGHGFQYAGENYLVPSDIDKHVSVTENSLSISEISYFFRSITAPKVMIIDACRSSTLGKGTLSISTGLNSQNAPPNTLIAYATAPGKVAFDGPNGGNSPYASAFVSSLNSYENADDVFRQTRVNTIKYTGGRQIPWESSSLLENISFNSGSLTDIEQPNLQQTISTYLNSSTSSSDRFDLEQREDAVDSYISAIDYLIEVTKNAREDSFLELYPEIRTSIHPERDRSDLIKTLNWQRKQPVDRYSLYTVTNAFQDGVLSPSCRKENGKLDHSCGNFDNQFVFKPNLGIAFRISKYADQQNINSSFLARHYKEGWNVPKNLLKAYDLYIRDKSLGGQYYWADANSMIQNELVNLGHNISVDGDFGRNSCNALEKYIGKTICARTISREQVKRFVKKLNITIQ